MREALFAEPATLRRSDGVMKMSERFLLQLLVHGLGGVARSRAFDNMGGDANRCASWRDKFRDKRARGDLGVGADLDRADKVSGGAKKNAGADFRMAVDFFRPGAAKGDALQNRERCLR